MFDFIDDVIDSIIENPVKSLFIVGATVATGGLALAYAPAIAATIGATGILGTAGTGATISTLTGVFLESASLAALGGGTLASGGGGMAFGATVVASAGAATGLAVSGTAVAVS
jgi:hypothetical protein